MDKPNEALQYTNLDDAAQCLREIGNQFICPPDDFFWRLADAIEEIIDTTKEIKRLRECISILDETVRRSGLDISPCRECGEPTLTIPDGLGSWCVDCTIADAAEGI